ncbi:MAG: YbaB/EbfC family nucleoid-associated protein [Bacillota bacterium]
MFDMKMLKQVQQMQQNLLKIQEELKERIVEASAGGGAVKASVSCGQELRSIVIDPSVVDPGDTEMLQDLIIAAVNEGLRLAKETSEREMGKAAAGLNLPGMPKLF